jgi:type I restriction enzyme S subunit
MPGKYHAYPEYKDSGIEWLGVIPKHWQIAELKRYSFVNGGYAFNSDSFVDDGEPVIRISDIKQDGSVSLENCKCVSGELANKYSEFYVSSGELVMAMTGATIGKAGWFRGGKPALVNQRVGVFKCNDKYLNFRFFWYLLSSYGYQEHIQLTAFGGAQPNISDTGMVGYKTTIPVIEEQEKIANFLDHETAKIDTLIEKQQQLIKLLKQKRQAVISHAVTKGLNPNAPMRDSGVEWLGEVPEHWKVCRIKQVAKLESGHTPDKKIEAYWVDCDIPWVSLNDTSQLKEVDYIADTAIYLNEKGIANSSARKLPERCVVFTRDASIGLAAITTRVMAVSQHVIAWVCDEEKVIPEYLLLVFYAMKDELDRYTFGATLKTIGMPDVNKLTGAFPDIEEQKIIVDHIFNMKQKIDIMLSKAEEAIKIIKERRTALISAAVTGKIDVRNWQAPASLLNNKEPNKEEAA